MITSIPEKYLRLIPYFLVLIFAFSLGSGFFWDDYSFIFHHPQIIENPNPFAFFIPSHDFQRSWPVGYFIFWILYRVFGTQAFLYKILLLVLHGLNIFLLDNFLKKYSISIRLLICTIFAIHPMHVETLSWVFQQNVILATTFALMTLLTFEHLGRIQAKSLFFFAISLMFKPYIFCFPIMFSLVAYYRKLERKW